MKITSRPPALELNPDNKVNLQDEPRFLEKELIGKRSQIGRHDTESDKLGTRATVVSDTKSKEESVSRISGGEKATDAVGAASDEALDSSCNKVGTSYPKNKSLYSSESSEDLKSLSLNQKETSKRPISYVEDNGSFVQKLPFKRGGGPLPKIKKKGMS